MKRTLIPGRSVVVALAALLLPATAALAHTTVASTSPKNGAVLAASPPVIEISFKAAANLTSVVVVAPGQPERKLEFTPKGSATSFKLPNPALVAGRNEIQWKALSKDGHVINGSLVLVIDAGANLAAAKSP
jgi:methionine-rich copper-binding protein CopC